MAAGVLDLFNHYRPGRRHLDCPQAVAAQPDPLRQMVGGNWQSVGFFSGNLTPSANSIGWRRGGGPCIWCLTSVFFWPSANSMAWRNGPGMRRTGPPVNSFNLTTESCPNGQ